MRGYQADVFQAGTACLAGAALLPCGDEHFAACVVAVGNVHAFLCRSSGAVIELTAGSLAGARNPSDTCGRLGPYVDNGDPDLRNLQRYFCECREGDWLWLVSPLLFLCCCCCCCLSRQVTDSVVRNCSLNEVLDASAAAGSRALRACEERTSQLREFLAATPQAAAPAHLVRRSAAKKSKWKQAL